MGLFDAELVALLRLQKRECMGLRSFVLSDFRTVNFAGLFMESKVPSSRSLSVLEVWCVCVFSTEGWGLEVWVSAVI